MSEPIPESIPTSADPKSRRPTKKARGLQTPTTAQSAAVSALFDKHLDREINIPASATIGPKTAASLAKPPEIVANVQGSSAGAGSGEFHVYKASRRRENERVRLMEEEAKREAANQAWESKIEENRRKDDEKTGKNARKRAKMKARKEKAKSATADGRNGTENNNDTLPNGHKSNQKLSLKAGKPSDSQLKEGVSPTATSIPGEAAMENAMLTIHDDDD